jgi:predicted transcriptional regulator
MFKVSYHPKAFLLHRRNMRRGLTVRSKIILSLEEKPSCAKELAEKVGVKYSSVLHHLHLLETERVAVRQGETPYLWILSGVGQQRLDSR